MIRYLLALISGFVLSALLTVPVIKLAKKLKLRQTVLSYVDNHASKSGTPTMGGIAFVLASAIVTLIFRRRGFTLGAMLIVLMLGFALIGFLDDFIKVYFKQNKGLSPKQKIIFQLIVSFVIAVFTYDNPEVADRLYIPFTLREISLGWFAVPFYMFIFIAFTNAVNLTDGLDGLAGKTATAYGVFFTAVIAVIVYSFGVSPSLGAEYSNLIIFTLSLIGALCGFLLYNSYPAKIFMGDTGALALGGALAGLAVMTKLSLIAPIIGVMYVLSCVSDVLQVLYFKRTGKRIFKMAPLHHHLERCGMHENKIVTLYTLITFLMGAVTLVLILVLN